VGPRPGPGTARDLAVDVLDAVLCRQQQLDDAFDRHPLAARLDSRDRAFALNLAATTLRRLGEIDAVLAGVMHRAPATRQAVLRHILRLGAAQLLFLATPPHAAVHTAVDLAQRRGFAGLAPLVNALLRRISRDGSAILAAGDAERLNTPDWLWQSWASAYGEAACRRIAHAHLDEPPLDLTAKTDAAALAERLGGRLLATGTVRLASRAPVTTLPGFAEGDWWVQDAAAALPARLLGDVRGRRVIDLCAAPGGKTAQLAAAGAHVTAVDRGGGRMRRLSENLARLHLEATTVVADAATWRPAEPADAVLVDVPCTATGTIRRHPDVARLKRPADVATLTSVQDRLLQAAVAMTRPGGVIVYCACSLQPEEGALRLQALFDADTPAARLPVTAEEVGGVAELITRDGDLRTLPWHLGEQGGMDGFYAARLVRR
jgi:16S rRNA (cytosine967-C5)-methyltransferase